MIEKLPNRAISYTDEQQGLALAVADVWAKLNELIDVYNEHTHEVDLDSIGLVDTSIPAEPRPAGGEGGRK